MASGNPTVTTKLLSEDVSFSSGLESAEQQLDELARSFGDTYEDLTPAFQEADDAIAHLDDQIESADKRMKGFNQTITAIAGITASIAAVRGVIASIDEFASRQEEQLGRYHGLIGEYADGWIAVKNEVREVNMWLSRQAESLASFFGGMVGLEFGAATQFRAADPQLNEMVEERNRLIEIMNKQMRLVVAEERKRVDILDQLTKMNRSLIKERERMIETGVDASKIDMLIMRTQKQISDITIERWSKDLEARDKALEKERRLAEAEAKRHAAARAAAGREAERLQAGVERAEKRLEDIEFQRQQFFERDRGFRSETFNDPAALANRLQGGLFNRADNARQQQLERLDRRLRQAQEQHQEALREQRENTTRLIRELGIPGVFI